MAGRRAEKLLGEPCSQRLMGKMKSQEQRQMRTTIMIMLVHLGMKEEKKIEFKVISIGLDERNGLRVMVSDEYITRLKYDRR